MPRPRVEFRHSQGRQAIRPIVEQMQADRYDQVDWDGMVVKAKYDANVAICRNAVTNLMVKSGATYTYLYVDENGEEVGSVTIEKCYNT